MSLILLIIYALWCICILGALSMLLQERWWRRQRGL